jgi:hypothetical protein
MAAAAGGSWPLDAYTDGTCMQGTKQQRIRSHGDRDARVRLDRQEKIYILQELF